jgi:MYXO-CTERM domain-containing protein
MRHSRVALASLCLAYTVGCTDPGSSLNLARDESAIVNGQLSDPSDDAVVAVYGQGNNCTGTLIAPDVVLTALHCVTNFDSRFSFTCQSDGTLAPGSTNGQLGATLDPSLVTVGFGVLVGKTRIAATAIYGTNSPEVCRDDMAVVVLESAVPVGDVPLVALRFDRTTKKGEIVRALGYGDVQTTQTEPGRQVRDGIVVRGVGGPNVSTPGDAGIAPRTLQVGEGPCHGDSGGPLMSEDTGAELGVYSLLNASSCIGTSVTNTYTQVAPFESLIRSALASVGEEPIVEPAESTGAGGEAGTTGQVVDPGSAGAVGEGGAPSAAGGSGDSAPLAGGGSGAVAGAPAGSAATSDGNSAGVSDQGTGSGSRQDSTCAVSPGDAHERAPWSWAAASVVALAFAGRRRRTES